MLFCTETASFAATGRSVAGLSVVHYFDSLSLQLLRYLHHCFAVLLGIRSVQLVDDLQRAECLLTFRLRIFPAAGDDAPEQGYTHAEKLIKVVGVDAQE